MPRYFSPGGHYPADGASFYTLHGAILLAALLCIAPLQSPAQTAHELETILESKAVSYAMAARLVLEAADVAVFNDPDEAFRFAAAQGYLPKKAAAGGDASLSGISLLLMRSFDIKGGLFYSIFKNPHYAYRELVYREIILGKTEPNMAVTGDDLLFMVGCLLSLREESPAQGKPPAPAPQKAAEEQGRHREELAKQINDELAAMGEVDITVSATTTGVTINLFNIQFLADSAEMAEGETNRLADIAFILSKIPGKILVEGHTARAGTEEGQLRISLERAQAVASYLESRGVRKPGDIAVQGHGAQRLLTTDTGEAGMIMNRRVEITILEE